MLRFVKRCAIVLGFTPGVFWGQIGSPVVFRSTPTGAQVTLPVTIRMVASGVATDPTVTNEGVGTGDYSLVDSGSCTAGMTFTPGRLCSAQVSFAPLYPGRRNGALLIKSTDGRVLGVTMITGVATGPLPRLSPGQIDTVAGGRSWIYTGDDVSAVGAPIFLPMGLAADVAGNLFLSDSSNSRIRRVDAVTGLISTIVGTGIPGYNGDGLSGTQTSISQPAGMALDGAGNLYFADAGNGLIRKWDVASRLVSIVAGAPNVQSYTGDGGPATSASLSLPEGLAFGSDGTLLISDTGNNVLRAIDPVLGYINTIAGTGTAGFSGDGGPARLGRLNSPWSLAVAPDGSILFADFSNNRVRKVSVTGVLSTVAGTGTHGFSGDGGSSNQAELSEPAAVALDPAGNVYIADSGNNRIRMVSAADGTIATVVGNSGDSFAGDGGPADEASLYGPYALFFDARANLFVADMFHNRVRRVNGQGLTLAYPTIRVSKTSAPQAEALANSGNAELTLGTPGLNQAGLDAATTTCLIGNLAAGLTCDLGVEFAPTVIGADVHGFVTLNSNAGGLLPQIVVHGGVLSVEPTSVALVASANPALVGSALLLTATVSSDDTSRSGLVNFLDGGNTVCTAALDGNGVAACTINNLTVGSHNLTASYAGDANNASSVSPVLTEVIKQEPQLLLEASPNPTTVTAPVTLKLTASANNVMPTGGVSFLDGTTVMGTGTLNNQGVVTFTTAQMVPGTHVLSALYAGDVSNAAKTSNAVSEVVQQASTVTILASNQVSTTVGTALLLTGQTNSVNGPAPTGSISFTEGSSTLGTVTLTAGQATLSLSSLQPGVHNIVATYSGDTDNAASSSHSIEVTITRIDTLLTMSADSNPLSAGSVLRLNATIALVPGATASGAFTGTISFMEGASLLGTDIVDFVGHSTLAIPGLAVGVHEIVAIYSGGTNYAASTSEKIRETVAQTATSVSLNASTISSLSGKAVTFTIAVASATGIPTGTVTLHDGSITIAQAVVTPSGTASFTLSSLGVGAHTLVATYLGDVNYSASTSAAAVISVALGQPTLSLSGPVMPVNVATTTSFSATLSSTGVAPTGTLTLHDSNTIVATQIITAVGTVTFTSDALALGTHYLTVRYSGDQNTASANSATITVLVQQAPSSITLTAGPNPVTAGSTLHLGTVATSSSPHMSGTVTFQEGATTLGSANLGTDGTAGLDVSTLPPGVHLLSAMYGGDANHAASSVSQVSVRVVYPLVATLSSSANPAISGTIASFSVRLSSGVATANGDVPTGKVGFSSDGASLGTVTLDATGTASFSTKDLAVGLHTIAVSYGGDLSFAVGSATLVQTITNASTRVSLRVSANPVTYGSSTVLTATVQSDGGTATGPVVFRDGELLLGSASLDAQGFAQLTLSSLRPGTRILAATYAGDGRASASASAPLSVDVKQTTTVNLSSTSNPSLTLNEVRFTATIVNAGASVPTGTVTFADGSNALGTVQVDSNGQASLLLQQMSAGNHFMSVNYAGDDNDFASLQPGTLTETVQLRSTTTALTSSSTDVKDPQKVTLIAIVRGEGNTPPTGTATFLSGTTKLGTSAVDTAGVATLTIELEQPQESIAASYGGDAAYSSSISATGTVTAGAATQFSLAVTPQTLSVITKNRSTIMVTMQSVKGFNDTLKLGCLGLPFAATCTFSTPEVKLDADETSVVELILDTGNPLGAGAQVSATRRSASSQLLLCMTSFGTLAFVWRSRRRKLLQPLLLALLATGMVFGLSGCGGLQVTSTPVGQYTFKITASGVGSGATQSQTVSLTVTQ